MAYPVSSVISEAYFDAGVVARQFEELQGYQLNDGLNWLNQILGDRAMNTGDIPYITQQYPLYGVVGQETYFVPNLISIDAMVFYIGSVRYQMQYVDRIKYFGQPRANNINALPVSYTYERVPGGCNVWVYFWPQSPFLFNITGNFFLQNVSLGQDLSAAVATANLGTPVVSGAGTLNAGGLVINNVDMAGAYSTIDSLISYINANSIGVFASVTTGANAQFSLTGILGNNIFVETDGAQTLANTVNFSKFSTTAGLPLNQTFTSLWFDQFYINYLEYELAERICSKLNFTMPEEAAKQLERYRNSITNLAEPLDLTCQKVSCLQSPRALNYAQANIGRGYTVSGI